MTRKTFSVALMIAAVAALTLAAGCGSSKKVTRTDVDTQIDLSGEWNDVDSRQVADALVMKSTATPWIENFRAENGDRPTIIIGQVGNKTTEHIPVRTSIADLENSLINNGRVKVVASATERDQLRDERTDQQQYSSVETMKQWGREVGADFMLIGEINTLVDQEDGEQVKYYRVDCYFVGIEDNVKVWVGTHEIKKYVGRKSFKP